MNWNSSQKSWLYPIRFNQVWIIAQASAVPYSPQQPTDLLDIAAVLQSHQAMFLMHELGQMSSIPSSASPLDGNLDLLWG